MQIAITGSIATDHLLTFKGRFADSLVVEQLDKVSLSFLAEDLEVRRGGVAANIAFGMANLGQRPILVGAVGEDFADYRSWLERQGVDCDSVHVSESKHTARFVCTTDEDMAQIATFYAGAMTDAREIELAPIAERVGGLDLVVIGANDPVAMVRHTEECRERGYAFAADPSQQLAFCDGPTIARLIEGAEYLFTNEYESHLTCQKTGWSEKELAEAVRVQVTTCGKDGVVVRVRGEEPVEVGIAREVRKADPTGVGDAFRAGFLAATASGLSLERGAQLGSLIAVQVLETDGGQEWTWDRAHGLERLRDAYGPDAAAEIDAILPH